MAERSVDGLLALLGPPKSDGDAMDTALACELERAHEALQQVDDGTKVTADALALLAILGCVSRTESSIGATGPSSRHSNQVDAARQLWPGYARSLQSTRATLGFMPRSAS